MLAVLRRILCLVRGHEHHVWSDASGQCLQVSVCVRCGAKGKRFTHLWLSWQPTLEACKHAKQCERCGQSMVKPLHTWILESGLRHKCAVCGVCENHVPVNNNNPSRCVKCGCYYEHTRGC